MKRAVWKRTAAGLTTIFLLAISDSYGEITNGLVAYYSFDGSPANVLGTGNDGIARGALLTTDRFGETNKAYSLVAMEAIVLPEKPPLLPQGSFTYAFWVLSIIDRPYPSPEPYSWLWLFDRTTATAPVVSLAVFTRNDGLNEEGSFWFFPRYDDWSVAGTATNSAGIGGMVGGSLKPQQWQHIAMVRDYSEAFKLYVNGEMVASAADNGKSLTPPAVSLGRNPLYGQVGLIGKVDDFRIYDRALSATEVGMLAGRVYATTAGASLVLSWDAGPLLSADDPKGPWEPLQGATPPWPVSTGAGKKFYRIR